MIEPQSRPAGFGIRHRVAERRILERVSARRLPTPLRTLRNDLEPRAMEPYFPATVANLIRLAQQFQRENGGFLPFGEICQCGKRTYQAVGDEHLPAPQVISALDEIYREKIEHGAMEWAALCIDVHLTDPVGYSGGTDAIQVEYEDQTGRSESYFVPYRQRSKGIYEYDPVFRRQKAARWLTS